MTDDLQDCKTSKVLEIAALCGGGEAALVGRRDALQLLQARNGMTEKLVLTYAMCSTPLRKASPASPWRTLTLVHADRLEALGSFQHRSPADVIVENVQRP